MIGWAGARLPSVPKLMLIASAPRFVASTIELATEASLRSVLTTINRQSEPGAHDAARRSPPAAQAIEETCVPWPISSVVGGPLPAVPSWSEVAAIFPASSGWAASRPVSITPTVAAAPRVTSHAANRPERAAHHCDGHAGGGSGRGLWRGQGGVVGLQAQLRAALDLHGGHRGARRSERAVAARVRPAPGRTVTRSISGTRRPAGSAAAAAAMASADGPSRRSGRAAGLASSVTAPPRRPVEPVSARADRRRGQQHRRERDAESGRLRRSDAGVQPGAAEASGDRASEAERELRVFAHLLRRPGGVKVIEDATDFSTPSSSETNSSICSVTCGPIGHAGRGERERDVHVALVDLDAVDEAELDEVEPELGVDDVAEGLLDLFDGWH